VSVCLACEGPILGSVSCLVKGLSYLQKGLSYCILRAFLGVIQGACHEAPVERAQGELLYVFRPSV
jgi:hypothetical protein